MFVPWFWQNVTNLAFIDVLMSALDNVNASAGQNESDRTAEAGYSIQRLSLENSLNVQFDNDLSRILVVNGGNVSTYIFNEAEAVPGGQEIYIWNEAEGIPGGEEAYFFNTGEATTVNQFIVYVPTSLAGSENAIRAWIERVQMLGTEYSIIYI